MRPTADRDAHDLVVAGRCRVELKLVGERPIGECELRAGVDEPEGLLRVRRSVDGPKCGWHGRTADDSAADTDQVEVVVSAAEVSQGQPATVRPGAGPPGSQHHEGPSTRVTREALPSTPRRRGRDDARSRRRPSGQRVRPAVGEPGRHETEDTAATSGAPAGHVNACRSEQRALDEPGRLYSLSSPDGDALSWVVLPRSSLSAAVRRSPRRRRQPADRGVAPRNDMAASSSMSIVEVVLGSSGTAGRRART